MYRLIGPKSLIFICLTLIAIFFVSSVPYYFSQLRIMSVVSLLVGEVALSFIPVIILFPKATLVQALILGVIYLLSTLMICFGAWGVNALGWTGQLSFVIRAGQFYLNTLALFTANFFALIILMLNFKLKYDEELTKEAKNARNPFSKDINPPSFNRPKFTESEQKSSKQKSSSSTFSTKSSLDEDFWKPFEFEPEISTTSHKLPEESSGNLFSTELKDIHPEEKSLDSEFQQEDDTVSTKETIQAEKPKSAQLSSSQPTDIKNEIAAIFEQYSSLDSIKKITSTKTDKPSKNKFDQERRKKRQKDKSTMSIKVEGEGDVHEATFRQLSEEEKIDDIKEELLASLKSELKKELEDEPNEPTQEDLDLLAKNLAELSRNEKIHGSLYANLNGNLILDNVKENHQFPTDVSKDLSQLFNNTNKQISKTKQGNLLHILLESSNGTLILANTDDMLLAVKSNATKETDIGQHLKEITELEGE